MGKNILYYIPSLNKSQGGIFQYAMRVLEDISKTDNKIFILNFTEKEYLKENTKSFSNVTIIPDTGLNINYKLSEKIKRICSILNKELRFFPTFNISTIPNRILSRYKIDFVHSPTQGFPRENIPFAFTLHDVQELHMPEYFTPLERESRARNNRIGCEKAQRIVVSYNHVKKDLIRYFHVPEEVIDVVFIGTSDNSLTIRTNSLEIDSKFILYPAATWPHKNHNNLLKAFAMALKTNALNGYKLICTGHKTPHFSILNQISKDLGIEESVIFKGIVSDEELKSLYSECRAVVVPTKYEAGSFPLMESIAQAIPVVCSDITSLPETIGNSKFTFNPDSISEISEKIIRICTDDSFRQENIENSLNKRRNIMDRDLKKKFEIIYSKFY